MSKIKKYSIGDVQDILLELLLGFDDYSNPIQMTAKEVREKIIEFMDKVPGKQDSNLSRGGKALVGYFAEVTAFLANPREVASVEESIFKCVQKDDPILDEYIEVFKGRFEKTFKQLDRYFMVEVWWNRNIIGMFFKQRPIIRGEEIEKTMKVDKTKGEFISRLTKLDIVKDTDQLFIQRDIKGFEEDGFYVIKPNERMLWHKAIAYQDMYEIASAILKAGKEKYEELGG